MKLSTIIREREAGLLTFLHDCALQNKDDVLFLLEQSKEIGAAFLGEQGRKSLQGILDKASFPHRDLLTGYVNKSTITKSELLCEEGERRLATRLVDCAIIAEKYDEIILDIKSSKGN